MPAAANLLQRAAALLDEQDPVRALLLLDAGEAAVDIGELEQAESMLTEAVDRALFADENGIARAAALALLQLRYTTDAHAVQESIGRQESMVELVELEIPELEAMGDDRALVRAFRLLTYVHWTGSRFADAAAAAERTIRHATAAGDEVTARRFLGSLAISALYGPMPVPEAIATCEEVLARAEDDRKARALAELAIGHLEAMRGNFDRARLLYRRSRASLEEFGYLLMAALTSLDSSVIELLAGDLAAAESELRTDYRRLEEMGERNYISTTAGLLADVLYRQDRYDESAEFAEVCEHLASPDDVASQFLWRCVRGKLRAREGAIDEAESLLSAATALIETSDQLDLQGNGLLDFAEVRELAGAPADAAGLGEQAAALFERKGNIVSALRARQLAERLRSTPASLVTESLTEAGRGAHCAQPPDPAEREPGWGRFGYRQADERLQPGGKAYSAFQSNGAMPLFPEQSPFGASPPTRTAMPQPVGGCAASTLTRRWSRPPPPPPRLPSSPGGCSSPGTH